MLTKEEKDELLDLLKRWKVRKIIVYSKGALDTEIKAFYLHGIMTVYAVFC